jgi:hypothetical protein
METETGDRPSDPIFPGRAVHRWIYQSYFGDLRSKTHPQYAANADVFSRTRAGTMYVRNVGNAPGSKLGNVASASLNGLSPEGLLRRRPSTRLRKLWTGMEQGQTSAP